jgi:hypothetical protein
MVASAESETKPEPVMRKGGMRNGLLALLSGKLLRGTKLPDDTYANAFRDERP